MKPTKHTISPFIALAIIFLLVFSNQYPSFAAKPLPTSSSSKSELALRQTILEREADTVEKLKQEIEQLKERGDSRLAHLQDAVITDEFLQETKLAAEAANVNVESVKLDIASEKRRIEALKTQINSISTQLGSTSNGNSSSKASIAELKSKLQQYRALLKIEQQYLAILNQKLNLLKEKAALASSWWKSVQAVYQKQQEMKHQESLDEMKKHLAEQEEKARKESEDLERQLASINPDDPEGAEKRQLINRRLEYLEQSLDIMRTTITLQSLKSRFDSIGNDIQEHEHPGKLRSDLDELRDIKEHTDPLIAVTTGKLQVVQQEWALIQKQYALKNISDRAFYAQKKLLTDLINQYTSLLESIKALENQIEEKSTELQAAYAKSIQESLTARQGLPTDIDQWKAVGKEITSLPQKLQALFAAMISQVKEGWRQSGNDKKALFFGICLLLIIAAILAERLPSENDVPDHLELRLSARLKTILFALLRTVRPCMLAGGIITAASYLFGMEKEKFHILLLFVIVILALQFSIRLSYLVFASRLVAPSERQPRLHRMITAGLIFGAFFALLMGLSNAGVLSGTVKGVIDRMFMVLLLLSVYFFMRLRAMIIQQISPKDKGRLWVHLVEFASLSIPITALCAAVVGLAGYINLARFVAGQLVLFLAVIIAWLLARDLARDLLDHWRPRIEESSAPMPESSGASITSSLKRLLDLLFIYGFLWSLAKLYGWNTGNSVDLFLKQWLDYPLLHVGNQTVTFAKIAGSAFLLLLFIYLSTLVRHLTFVLIHRNVEDRGLRNSLSIFAQYAVLVIGAIVVMHTMGLDLTSLTVFAGALGVGIGFGLQNIANNLISGLIILAERPVRVEDWVSIGDNQGIISRIGMRSLVLTTWDNQDVIIPNADLITSPVTNWTLSDNLIRTILQVGIRYQDDPHRAQEVILEAVSMVPEVSLEKKPRVYLSEFADSSVNFRVDYYSSIDTQHGRNSVKSAVMFAIWDALKDADIGIPFPQQDIYIKEVPQSRAWQIPASEIKPDSPPVSENEDTLQQGK